MDYSVPYGKEQLNFSIPRDIEITVITPNLGKPLEDLIVKTRDSILHPTNSKPLLDLAKGKNSACIVVTDITRDCPDKELLSPILETLEYKIPREKITILIANGMHRKMTTDEKITKYGKDIVDNYRIIDHDSKNKENLVFLGNTKNKTPISISKIAYESELLISLGVVEPHQFAGYSGGYKTIAIGVAGDDTISQTHSSKMLANSETGLSTLDGNPISEDIIEIGQKAGLDFIVNVVIGPEQNVLAIKAGEPQATQKALIKIAQSIFEVPVDKLFDFAICGVGFPKDTNLYQVSRAASYLSYASTRVIKDGGYIIIPAQCQEGAGLGVGEKRFFEMLQNKNIEEIINLDRQFKAGEQRAFFMANVLSHYKVIIVNSQNPEIIKQAKMIPAKNMDEAFEIVKKDLGDTLNLLLIPNSLITLPIIK